MTSPVMADGGDDYVLRFSNIWRVIDKYGNLFPDRIGPLDGAFDVISLTSFQDRLLAVQKNGRVFVFCPTTARKGVWAVIAVDMSSLEVTNSQLYVVDGKGRRYVYTGDLRSEDSFWLAPSVVFGNSIHNFKEVP